MQRASHGSSPCYTSLRYSTCRFLFKYSSLSGFYKNDKWILLHSCHSLLFSFVFARWLIQLLSPDSGIVMPPLSATFLLMTDLPSVYFDWCIRFWPQAFWAIYQLPPKTVINDWAQTTVAFGKIGFLVVLFAVEKATMLSGTQIASTFIMTETVSFVWNMNHLKFLRFCKFFYFGF